MPLLAFLQICGSQNEYSMKRKNGTIDGRKTTWKMRNSEIRPTVPKLISD